MKIKTSTLTGTALNWAVSKADGCEWLYEDFKAPSPPGAAYSTDWSQGGPILTEARISRTIDHLGLWVAYWTDGYGDGDKQNKWMQCDCSELVAGLRCFVASKLGDEIEIPQELL